MPDHFHAIIAIHPMNGVDGVDVETPRRGIATIGGIARRRAGSLGAIVGQWKTAATKRIRADPCADFAWQSHFYDVIIRDTAMLARMHRYIADNPRRWAQRR